MTKIVFWTSAKPSAIRATIGRVLRRIDPTPVHKFVPVDAFAGAIYVPAQDEIVLACGKDALQILATAGIVPKGRAIDSLRGKVWQKSLEEGRYMLSYDPGIVDLQPGMDTEIAWDVQLIARLARTGSLDPVYGDYQWVSDFGALIERIKARFEATGKPVPVSGDIETYRLSPFQEGARIVAVGFTERAGHADLLYVPDIGSNEQARLVHSQIAWLLTSPMVRMRGANFKFDLNWFLVLWKIDCTNYSMDTVLVGSLLDENRSNSLKTHVKVYVTDLGGYDDGMTQHDMENMHTVPKDKLRLYLGGDVDGTYQASGMMLEDLGAHPNLTRFYLHVSHPGSVGFQRIEREGVCVDLARFKQLEHDLQVEATKLHAEGLSLLPARLRAKFADNLSLSRPAILKEYFFSPMGLNLKPLMVTGKTKEPSTAKNHLEMFFDVPEAKAMCSVLDGMNQANKALSTYVVGFLKHLRKDGRLHPSYFMHKGDNDWGDDGGAVTGRLSAKDPPIQTVPKKTKWGKRIRSCFVGPPGYVIIEADFSQGELRIAACVANEPAMIAAYKAGIDLHMKTGADLAGLSLDEMIALKATDPDKFALYRGKAKPANFGIIYGISGGGYQAYAWNGYRVKISLEEAENTVDVFLNKTYPELPKWHQRYKNMAHQQGYVLSPMGRVRHLPHISSPLGDIRAKAERQAVNSPVQATLSDMMVMAIGELNRSHPEYIPFAMIHDAGYWYVPEDRVDEAAANITETMGNLPLRKVFGWDHQLDFPADASVGLDLGHMEEWKRKP